MAGGRIHVRPAVRHDVPALVDLRVAFLAEAARSDPRLRLLPDVRQRSAHALPVWLDQDERVLLVAEPQAAEGAGGPLVGYATGVASVWPPIFRQQHVGEVAEAYVVPEARGTGVGSMLLAALTDGLRARGARVFRTQVVARDEPLVARFLRQGYGRLQLVMERSLDE